MTYSYPLTIWLIIQLFGLIGLPIALVLFKNLPDKGYPFAKTLGLLLTGYVLWLGGSFGLIRNNLGGTIIAMLVVAGLGGIWAWPHRKALRAWLKANRAYIATVEMIYGVALVGWTYYKAYNPEITPAGGEKWMEIAFINTTLLSSTFPPQDPWLAGYGISYYYFGYVLMSMLIRLSGIVATTAYNLLIPTLFGLTLIGAYGIVTNLICVHQRVQEPTSLARGMGLLGPLFVGLMGHWEGLLEVLHSRGLLRPEFWQWLDIRDLKIPPQETGPWIPTRYIWWWRGSRVLTDYDLAGREQEVIDEIPFFSFLLGDVHPHVLALPFVLLAITLAFNLLLNRRRETKQVETKPKAATFMDNVLASANLGQSVRDLVEATGGRICFLLYAISIGALGFLNTWDLPIYLAVLGLAYWLWRSHEHVFEPVFGLGVFTILCLILYSPFYLTFQSQAGGLLPNLWNPTQLPQFIVFFGPFLVSIITFLIALSGQNWPWRKNLKRSIPLVFLTPIILLTLFTLIFIQTPAGQGYMQSNLTKFASVQDVPSAVEMGDLWREIVRRRATNPWTFLLVGGLLAWTLAYWWAGKQQSSHQSGGGNRLPKDELSLSLSLSSRNYIVVHRCNRAYAAKFVLTLLIVGLLLLLSVEFVFLQDLFNIRMNTIFKFYFQAWILLSLAAAYGVYYVRQVLSDWGRLAWLGLVGLIISAALIYPVLAIFNKTNNFAAQPSLDGIAWVADFDTDDHAAILWLRQNVPPDAVILEAPGASYRYDNRISALTGRATLLGWGFHENQWRGNYDEPRLREADIAAMFNHPDSAETLTLFEQYEIGYVYVGALERQQYNSAGIAKFEQIASIVFAQGKVVIYEIQ